MLSLGGFSNSSRITKVLVFSESRGACMVTGDVHDGSVQQQQQHALSVKDAPRVIPSLPLILPATFPHRVAEVFQ